QIDHAHIPPENPSPEPSAQRFGTRLFRSKSLCIGFDGVRTPVGFGTFRCREYASQKTLTMAFDHVGDPAYVDDVGAERKDHAVALRALLRPRSIAVRMNFTVSARPSNTASPIRKCPILSSTTCGSAAIVSAVP